ncbi:family 16 glycosylhydrolase [Bradyrhizobium sp. GCM10027634]|uniref:glycoside hydrolase family 16 protein n=1 Tax=unclassified Bradyrhizobium TaxID=2631580 RepID=UPI00263B5CE2|nr:glycoside hydrolase family 16 protein [Bradyrhizobium sp. WYCCWR 12677]MDN5001398.1 glycoside hydrolase family 16 protein [Bradyrhizobium sp. WYCCWR 12677]
MTLSAPAGYSSSDLVFQEDFSGTTLDSYWHNYITSNAANGWPWNSYGSGGSGVGGQYDADYFMPSQTTVSNGLLDLTATQQPVTGMNQGTQQTFPITSGTVSSYGNFEFNGGYLQISMKAPSGDGAWPGLWLMPGKGAGSSGDNFEIDIQEGGYTGSGPANQAFTWHLHTPSGTVGGTVDTGVDLTAAFHTYAIDWQPGKSITWYLDGKQIAQVTSAQVPIPNEPMELIMDNQVANSNATGWHTTLDSSTPSSMPMQIDAIQLYQKAGSGETVTGANVTPTTQPAVLPAVTQVTASPATGIEHAGDTIALSLAFNEAVTVTGTPTLSLNDGNTATYVGGSGTSTLTFKTTVASTDTNTAALAITGVSLPSGSSIKDASGVAANLSGAVTTFTGLQIDPILPAVIQTSASPGTGTEHVGDTVTLSVGFNEAVTVTGTPTLSLNDGGTATYVGGSGTGTLTFTTTVASTNTSTSGLAITGMNLPSGASIKDAAGAAANLSGAVTTFTGLQIDPTSTVSTPTGSTATTPVLTIVNNSLWVAGRGGTVDLGTKVTTTDSNDLVTVNITGLPKYESITDKLDGQTFQGKNITLTAAQVDSGLTLTSTYRGGGQPVATLTLTASAKDPSTGAVATALPQTITVTDPRPTTAATSTTSQTLESTDHQQTSAANTGVLASRGFALLQQHFDPAASTLATTAAHPIMPADHPASTGSTIASLASQSFALLNQYLAAHTGQVDPGQIVAALSQATGWGHDSLLARPQH